MDIIFTVVVSFIGGAVTSYLVLRNNKDIKDKVDDIAETID